MITEWINEYLSLTYVLGVIVGILISGLINLTGVGGGVLIIPALSIIFALPPVTVVGTASMYATFTKFMSGISHIASKQVNWSITLLFLSGALPVCLAVAGLVVYLLQSNLIPIANIQNTVHYLTITFMIIAALSMLKPKKNTAGKALSNLWLLPGGAVVGLAMAITGVGGGALVIPILTLLTKEQVKCVVSCSIIIAFVISAGVGIVYYQGKQLEFGILIALLVGSVLGVQLSGLVRQRIQDNHLKFMIVGIILFSAIAMLVFKH